MTARSEHRQGNPYAQRCSSPENKEQLCAHKIISLTLACKPWPSQPFIVVEQVFYPLNGKLPYKEWGFLGVGLDEFSPLIFITRQRRVFDMEEMEVDDALHRKLSWTPVEELEWLWSELYFIRVKISFRWASNFFYAGKRRECYALEVLDPKCLPLHCMIIIITGSGYGIVAVMIWQVNRLVELKLVIYSSLKSCFFYEKPQLDENPMYPSDLPSGCGRSWHIYA